MDFKINKTTEQIISVDVPKYFKSKWGSQLTKLDQNGITKVSNMMIIHHNYDSIEQYIERMNRYSTEHAVLKVKEGYKFSWKDLIVKPANEFLSRYFFGEGHRDGLYGLALSLLQAFSELTVYLKIWQKEKFAGENPGLGGVISVIREKEKDLHYWESDSLFKERGSLSDRIRRKFRI